MRFKKWWNDLAPERKVEIAVATVFYAGVIAWAVRNAVADTKTKRMLLSNDGIDIAVPFEILEHIRDTDSPKVLVCDAGRYLIQYLGEPE